MRVTETDYRELPPQADETTSAYATRLEDAGYDEAFIRKGLAEHFGMNVDEMGAFFESFPAARLRHIALLLEIAPNRTEYSLTVKLSRNLGISREAAERWVRAFRRKSA
jgi:hypothetical protein